MKEVENSQVPTDAPAQAIAKAPARRRLGLMLWLRILAIFALLSLLSAWSAYRFLPAHIALPKSAQQLFEPLPESRIEDRNGLWLAYQSRSDHYRQAPLEIPIEKLLGESIPDKRRAQARPLIQALLAAEDKNFFQHRGIDFSSVARSAWLNLRHGKIRSGASTLSMQLAKIALLREDRAKNIRVARGWKRKLQEMLLARQMEEHYSKKDILRAYLEHADFGQLCLGAQTASRYYFNRRPDDIKPAQAALLIAQLQAPTLHNPTRHPIAAIHARNRILHRMGLGDSWQQQPMQLQSPRIKLSPHLLKQAGRLSIDAKLQQFAQHVIRREIGIHRGKNVQQAALLVIDNKSGDILASIASAQKDDPRGGQMNGTKIRRSAGSTLKPFIYLLALEDGAFPGSTYADILTEYPDAAGISAPHNYEDYYMGPTSMRIALASSQNIPAMRALNSHGGEKQALFILRQLGYQIPDGNYGLGLAIGNVHVSLEEQARAFATLARGGKSPRMRQYIEGYSRENSPKCNKSQISSTDAECSQQVSVKLNSPSSPNSLEKNTPNDQQKRPPLSVPEHARPEIESQIISPQDSFLIGSMLSDNNARSSGFGIASSLKLPFHCPVKTGTSSNYRDNWCIGYSRDYTVAVWLGNFDNSAMEGVSGLTGSAPIFQRMMLHLHPGKRSSYPSVPIGITQGNIDSRTGKLIVDNQLLNNIPPQFIRREYYNENQRPELIDPKRDYDSEGRAYIASDYLEWLTEAGLEAQKHYAIHPEQKLPRRPLILSPGDGIQIIIDESLPLEQQAIPLNSTLNSLRAQWSSPSLRIIRHGVKLYIIPEKGEHEVHVTDSSTGEYARSIIEVI